MRHKCLCALALCLSLAAPFCAAAEPLREDALETPVSFPLPPIADRPSIFALSSSAALLSLPDDPLPKAWPAVLILQDVLGADGRARPYIETLLGAGIAVLELREASAALAGEALAALAQDPRINPGQIGVLGFGAGARMALELPGIAARALLYPGCATLRAARQVKIKTHANAPDQHGAWARDIGIRDFIGPADYAWNYNVANGAPGFTLPHKSAFVLLLHGTEDPANPVEACAYLSESLRSQGAEVAHYEVPGAGYAWDYPDLGPMQAALLPAPGMAERLSVRPWPAMAAQSAAEIAGFFAQQFSRGAP